MRFQYSSSPLTRKVVILKPADYKSLQIPRAVDRETMPQVGVLAGGLGTRLGSLSERVPKSLIEVVGQPILSHILDWVAAQGCTGALVLIGHLGERFEDFDHE